jgi:hypothetical protein
MIGKPWPIVRRCFQCGHVHAVGIDCDDARRLRHAAWITDAFAVLMGTALILGTLYVLRAMW